MKNNKILSLIIITSPIIMGAGAKSFAQAQYDYQQTTISVEADATPGKYIVTATNNGQMYVVRNLSNSINLNLKDTDNQVITTVKAYLSKDANSPFVDRVLGPGQTLTYSFASSEYSPALISSISTDCYTSGTNIQVKSTDEISANSQNEKEYFITTSNMDYETSEWEVIAKIEYENNPYYIHLNYEDIHKYSFRTHEAIDITKIEIKSYAVCMIPEYQPVSNGSSSSSRTSSRTSTRTSYSSYRQTTSSSSYDSKNDKVEKPYMSESYKNFLVGLACSALCIGATIAIVSLIPTFIRASRNKQNIDDLKKKDEDEENKDENKGE